MGSGRVVGAPVILPLLIPPAINVQDLDYWSGVAATSIHLLECLDTCFPEHLNESERK